MNISRNWKFTVWLLVVGAFALVSYKIVRETRQASWYQEMNQTLDQSIKHQADSLVAEPPPAPRQTNETNVATLSVTNAVTDPVTNVAVNP